MRWPTWFKEMQGGRSKQQKKKRQARKKAPVGKKICTKNKPEKNHTISLLEKT